MNWRIVEADSWSVIFWIQVCSRIEDLEEGAGKTRIEFQFLQIKVTVISNKLLSGSSEWLLETSGVERAIINEIKGYYL